MTQFCRKLVRFLDIFGIELPTQTQHLTNAPGANVGKVVGKTTPVSRQASASGSAVFRAYR